MLTNIQYFIFRTFTLTLDFILDVGNWISDLAARLWAATFDLTSVGLKRANKWIRRLTLSIASKGKLTGAAAIRRIRIFTIRMFNLTREFTLPMGHRIAGRAVRLWTKVSALTSTNLKRADKWIRPLTLAIVFKSKLIGAAAFHRIRIFTIRMFNLTLDFSLRAGRWTADMSVRLWARTCVLTSTSLDWSDKWIQPPTLSIVFEDKLMRVLVIHKKRVIAWETFLRSIPAESQNRWLAHRLKAFLKSNRIRRVQVVTSVPLRTSLLREVELPSIEQQYLDGVIASELAETIPFAQEDVDIAWRFRNPDEAHTASAVIVPRSVTDESVEAVNEAEVELSAIFSEAEAMAYAAGEDDALVVRLADRHASMALVMDGLPQMLNRVQYDPVSENQPGQLESVITSLEQLASNSGRSRRGTRRIKSLRVVLIGPEVDVTPLRHSLASYFDVEAQPNSPLVELPDNLPSTEYGINLGLAVAWESKIKQRMFSRIEIGLNLLQERHIPKHMPVKSGAAVAMLFILVGLALTATFEVRDLEADESALSSRVSIMQRQLRLRSGQANSIHQDAQSVRGVNQQLDGVLGKLQTETLALMDRVLAITDTAVSRGMSIPKLSPEGREFVVAGTSSSSNEVFDYAADLRKTGLFDDVLVLRLDMVDTAGLDLPGEFSTVLFQVKVFVDVENSLLVEEEPSAILKLKK